MYGLVDYHRPACNIRCQLAIFRCLDQESIRTRTIGPIKHNGRVGPIDLGTHPGHLFRRVQQVHTMLWGAAVSEEITPPQFAVLNGLAEEPERDQRTLAERVALDRSTAADVVARLVRRGLVERTKDSADGRRNLLRLTESGQAAHENLVRRTERMIEILLTPLHGDEREQLLALLSRVAEAGERIRDPGTARS